MGSVALTGTMILKVQNLNESLLILRCDEEFILLRNQKQKIPTNLDTSLSYNLVRVINSSLSCDQINEKIKLIKEDGTYFIHMDLGRCTNRHLCEHEDFLLLEIRK